MEIITQDGEVVETPRTTALVDTSAMVSLARAEIDMQIATARAYPRSIDKAMRNIMTLATLDEETAAECCYALVRGKKGKGKQDTEQAKAIEGPSIRLAEIAAQSWGNNRTAARVVAVNREEKYVEAEGVFHDLETNMAILKRVRRPIRTSAGYLFSEDMITVTGNAACSIAMRNSILGGIPRGVYRSAYNAARGIIAGTVQTLVQNREKTYKAFASYAVKPEQLYAALGVGGDADIGLDEIATLRAMFAAIKNGEATPEEMFAPPKDHRQTIANPFDDEPTTQATKKPEKTTAEDRDHEVSTKAAEEEEAAEAAGKAAADREKLAAIEKARLARAAEVDEAEKKAAPKEADPAPAKEPETKPATVDKAQEVADTVAALNIAFDRGVKAKHEGVARKALPGEYRDPGRTAEALKWMAGWDNAKAPE